MRNFQKWRPYHTAITTADYYQFPQPPYTGKGWWVRLVVPKTELPLGGDIYGSRSYPAKEIVIFAQNELVAQRAANLIHAARFLVEGNAFFSSLGLGSHAPILQAEGKDPSKLSRNEHDFLLSHQIRAPNFPLACMIAARVSRRLEFVYAIAKLRLSFEIFSRPWVDIDPFRTPNIPKSPFPEDHVRLSFAIVSAWSCIEELGFDLRASNKNPSTLPDGSWNPTVKQDLEARLRKGHINLKEKFLWCLRGPRTRIELRRAPRIVKKAEWAKYRVRDGEIEVIDALNYVNFLRSKISAHRSNSKLVRVLSVYDVANAQDLARRLFLEKLGYWRYRFRR